VHDLKASAASTWRNRDGVTYAPEISLSEVQADTVSKYLGLEPGPAHTARHVIAAHVIPHFWHPMTWRAISARPYRETDTAAEHVLDVAAQVDI